MSSGSSFAHLHTHTEFSMLDGAARIDDLVAAAVADGQPALGITDHGNMYGVLDFYRACRREGVNPIIGTEAYMAAESRHERPVRRGKVDDTGGDAEGGQKLYYHLTLLAEDNVGYANLLKLSSAAYLEGYYYKPRVDWELLERHHEGLIATTGCLGGVVLQALLKGDAAGAERRAARLQDIFGRDNLFVELQDHGLAAQRETNPQLIEIARRLNAPLLATNDSHYCTRADAEAHDALLCVQTGTLVSDPKRFKFEGDEHYLKSAAEMRHLFAELPEASDNTLLIAERANVEIEFGRPSLPEPPVPASFTGATYEARASAYLRHLTFQGAEERYGNPVPDRVRERLDYELGVIGDMGFAAYFLVVWDLIRHARESGIRVGPGRGSAAGCCVAYCLRIVDLDPIRYDLLFERFLNPGRKQMPDIDMDFDERYRAEMIRYAAERYGSDRVAQIVTFSTIKARAAVRDAARVLGLPYAVGDRVAKAMPPLVMGRDTPLSACMARVEGHEDGYAAASELRGMYESDPDVRRVIDVAKGLEGLRRQDGIHAAAVVITKDPLTEYLPIQRKPEPGGRPEDAPIVTQYEMHGVEELGLLKMDFLGLRNLSVIERALDLIAATTGSRPAIDAVPLDDQETLAMLRRADSVGVFQLEGTAMRQTMRALAPSSFDDVAALVALYRPGPMAANMHRDYPELKNKRKALTYLHPDLEPILRDTYGLMLYQESVMRVAQKFAGYTLEEADNLRKACLPAGTRLHTSSRGDVAIERVMQLADRHVQSVDLASAKLCFAEVADVWPVGVKPVYRLTTSRGYAVSATAEHRFLVADEWRPLGAIGPGDRVAVGPHRTAGGGAAVGRSRRERGVEVPSATSARHRPHSSVAVLSPERSETPGTGELVWDTVTSVEYVGELPCYDFEMVDQTRPYALADDVLVHNCGKKIRSLIAAEREKFVAGCVAAGYGEALGTSLFDIIEPFADYAFNKSHSYGYGLVAYQTAWLKAHYPVEYLCALLTSVKDDKDKTAVYLAECRALGIEVVVPDVNRSAAEFTPAPGGQGQGIVFGLAAVRNVGESLVERIVTERQAAGPFADIYDFCRRVDPLVLNKRTMESLVKAGAFDSLGHPRQGLSLVLEEIIDRTLERRRELDAGIATLFSALQPDEERGSDGGSWEGTRIPIPDREFEKAQRLVFEKEMLGLYVSDHPLRGLEGPLGRHTECSLAELRDAAAQDAPPGGVGEGVVRSVGGVVTELKRQYTKKGELMARFVLEDLEASMEVFVFPRVMADYGMLLENDVIVVVRGRLDLRDETPKLVCMELRRPELVTTGVQELRISLPLAQLSEQKVDRLKGVLLEHPGQCPVLLHVGDKVLRLPPEFNVDSRNGLVGELKTLLGANAIVAA